MTVSPIAGVILLAESTAVPSESGSIDQLVDVVAAAVDGGIRTVIVRDKHRPVDERAALVAAVRDLGAGVLLAADDPDADPLGADGLHLSARVTHGVRPHSSRSRWLGVSAHDADEIERAVAVGADYVTVSPVHPTESKPGYGPALGLGGLAAIVESSAVPVVALGGITTSDHVTECLAAGAVGVAVMGAVLRAPDPAEAAAGLVAPFPENSARNGSKADLYSPEFVREEG